MAGGRSCSSQNGEGVAGWGNPFSTPLGRGTDDAAMTMYKHLGLSPLARGHLLMLLIRRHQTGLIPGLAGNICTMPPFAAAVYAGVCGGGGSSSQTQVL